MKIYVYAILGLLLCAIPLNAQYEDPKPLKHTFHPNRIFSVEVSSTIGIGDASTTLMFFNNQYSLWQRRKQFINLQTGVGAGFMRNDLGKLASIGAPLGLVYVAGDDNGHFFEANLGGRLMLGFSLAEGFQPVPFFTPTVGYRYQIPGRVFFHSFVGMQYNPNLGAAPFVGLGVGYDY